MEIFLPKPLNTLNSIDLGAYENVLVPSVAVTGISISPNTLKVGMGQNTSCTATILPANELTKR
jgi:uncharacterized protein YjdB